MKTLVVQTAFIGDAVFTAALVDGLSKAGHEVEICVAPRAREVAEAMPAVRAVHVFDKRGKDRGPFGLARVAARMRGRFEVALLPHASVRSGALAFLARVPRRIGFAGAPGSIFYTERVRTKERAFLARERALLRAVGAPPGTMRLVARAPAPALPAAPLAALCIGSEWETKIWPPERYAALARRLSARGFQPVLLGGPRDKALATRIDGAIDTTGNSVGEALAILSRSAVCVGGDSGLVHAARALGVPTVALFGPTPVDVHELGAGQRAVTLALECSPCSAHGTRRCPLGHHRCMRDLDDARVAAACEAVLAP